MLIFLYERSRLNPYGLIISLNENYEANGDLFLDDGEAPGILEINAIKTCLNIKIIFL